MKAIGLIGGMSWNSTLEYYRIINELVAQRLGGGHSARLILYSVDFNEIEAAQHEGRWDDTAHILARAGIALKEAGADFLVICTNTMHKVADIVAKKANLPLLHIVDAAGTAVKEKGFKRVGVLGTRFVMTETFYLDRLRRLFDIEVVVPEEDDMAAIHRIIYHELCQGKIEASSRQICIGIINKLVGKGAEGIVLGCTELPLLIFPDDIAVPLFDTTRLHAEAAVNMSLAES